LQLTPVTFKQFKNYHKIPLLAWERFGGGNRNRDPPIHVTAQQGHLHTVQCLCENCTVTRTQNAELLAKTIHFRVPVVYGSLGRSDIFMQSLSNGLGNQRLRAKN
jgi:hypothetical protein